jgi:hypothetical protein
VRVPWVVAHFCGSTVIIPTELLDDFKHLAIDMKTTVSALIVQSMQQYLKDIKKK